jgi:lipopolysaccharide transport system permease protein
MLGKINAHFSSERTPLYERRLIHLRDLLRELVVRDMKVRYKRSVLGFAWTLITPLMQLLVFYFIFQVVLSFNIPRFSTFAFCGLLAWNWFQSSVSQAAGAMTHNRELIRKPGFPATILPVVNVVTNLIHFILALPILLFFLVISGSTLEPTILGLPILILVQFILTLSLAYLVATLNVIFRDIEHIIGVVLYLLYFLTPIFYDARIIPEQYRPFYRINPMVHLVEAYRDLLLSGVQPNWFVLLWLGLAAVILLYLSHNILTRTKYRFAEEL